MSPSLVCLLLLANPFVHVPVVPSLFRAQAFERCTKSRKCVKKKSRSKKTRSSSAAEQVGNAAAGRALATFDRYSTNGSGYLISFTPSAANASLPASSNSTIPTGPYAGLVGLATPYTLQVTAHTTYGSEVKLQREVQTIGVPVFQFGMFSQTDLAFFAGPNFNFGGRVHSNGNLWLASQSTLTTAAGAPVGIDAAFEIGYGHGFRGLNNCRHYSSPEPVGR